MASLAGDAGDIINCIARSGWPCSVRERSGAEGAGPARCLQPTVPARSQDSSAEMGGGATDPRGVSAPPGKFLEAGREALAGSWLPKASGARSLAAGAAGRPRHAPSPPQRDGNLVFAKLASLGRCCAGCSGSRETR